jgi:transposase
LRAEGYGKLLHFVMTPGQAHEAPVFDQLLQGGVKRPGRGRPRQHPKRIAGDKGYSTNTIRATLRRLGIRITIPHKSNQRRGPFDRELYRLRNRIERLINRLKQYRRIATRYEKHVDNYHAMWLLAAVILWLGFADTP